MKTALVIGITGQDGSYLAELLNANGYRVVGTSRRPDDEARSRLASGLAHRVELVTWDLRDAEAIRNILASKRPCEVFNCAAFTSGAGMFDNAEDVGNVNGLAVTRILEAIRAVDPHVRLCQASSSEIFADSDESPQSERTAVAPRSPYGAAKCYADHMIQCYRKHYHLFACSAILYNHESPRRGLGFVTRKIAREAARIRRGLASELTVGNLDASRDWGFAGDAVRAMWLMLQAPAADDFVIATGRIHTVREFCDVAFRHVGLDYRNHVREDRALYRSAEFVQLVGDSSKARRTLGWQPEVDFELLVAMMVDAELAAISSTGR